MLNPPTSEEQQPKSQLQGNQNKSLHDTCRPHKHNTKNMHLVSTKTDSKRITKVLDWTTESTINWFRFKDLGYLEDYDAYSENTKVLSPW